MLVKSLFIVATRSAVLLGLLSLSAAVQAHPADEFCFDAAVDPLLCQQLVALDSPDANQYLEPSNAILERSAMQTLWRYVIFGLDHILPFGFDHLLFILALILSTKKVKAILLQVSLFTLAHTVTIALVVSEVLLVSGKWVEVAIAATIVFVGLENIFRQSAPGSWRYIVVFGFGLIHGMGFAGALQDLGLPETKLLAAIIGFNLGVELGQLLFATIVFALIFRWMNHANFRSRCVTPLSTGIALVGAFWMIVRLS